MDHARTIVEAGDVVDMGVDLPEIFVFTSANGQFVFYKDFF